MRSMLLTFTFKITFMKNRFTLLIGVFISFFSSQTMGQNCTPLQNWPSADTFAILPIPFSDEYPGSGILDTAYVGGYFETVLQIKVPETFDSPLGPVPVDSFSVSAINGLPPNFDYVCNPPSCAIPKDSTGCIVIFGTAAQGQKGTYDLSIAGILHGVIDFNFDLPIANNEGFLPDGEYSIHIQSAIPDAVADNCVDAIDINNLFGAPLNIAQVSLPQNNTNNTSVSDPASGSECFEDGSSITNSIWFSFTSTDGSQYGISTIGCNTANHLDDTQMAIYEGDDCGNLTPVFCNEDEAYPNMLNAYLELPTNLGTTYWIMIDGFEGATGEFCLEVTNLAPNNVTNIETTAIQVFPNPTTGLLQLENVEAEEIQVFDCMGRLTFSVKQPRNSMDISHLPIGIYFLKIQAGVEVYSARVVKE